MKNNLKKIECDPSCGFMIRSHSEKEVVDAARHHVKDAHQKDVSASEMRSMMVRA